MKSQDIFISISEYLQLVEAEINTQADLIVKSWTQNGNQGVHIDRVVHHLIDKPGKMLRPALVLLSAGMAGWDPAGEAKELNSSLVKLAAAVELIHSASLIHDDIIDDEQMRRGQSALHRKHGNQTAVLVGDILYAQSFSLITSLKLPSWDRHLAIYQLYCDTTRDMCLGEIIEQRAIDENLSLEFSDYLNILKNKTAVLMSACCHSGAILAGADADTAQHLADFGLAFGLAFQLLDDHKDKDALIKGDMNIVEKALQQLSRARTILGKMTDSSYRDELIRACDFVLSAVGVTQT
ncbi:MAG: polyprenyl synthetase family protein [Spirochaetaceae bacterium]|nr:MAG: polyprenyl synthetase family protein [Spirochaetaceae bacterium]